MNSFKMRFKMERILKIVFVIALSFSLFACNDKKEIPENLDLTDLKLDLKLDFSKGKFKMKEGIANFVTELTDYIYNDNVENKVNTFRIRIVNDELLYNMEQPQTRASAMAPCETKKIKCYSKEDVEKALAEIIGEGDRDVDIKFRRHTLSVTIELKIHDVTGVMTLCIPYNTIESIVHKFNAASWFAAVRKEPMQTNVDSISSQVKEINLPFIAELGSATINLQDILGLQPGDILLTDQLVKNDLNIKVGNLVKFLGRPGIVGKKMAISITDVVDPPDQEEELE